MLAVARACLPALRAMARGVASRPAPAPVREAPLGQPHRLDLLVLAAAPAGLPFPASNLQRVDGKDGFEGGAFGLRRIPNTNHKRQKFRHI